MLDVWVQGIGGGRAEVVEEGWSEGSGEGVGAEWGECFCYDLFSGC